MKRVEELIDGVLRPVCAVPPLLSSTQSSWAGFLLERDVCRDGSAETIFYPFTDLVLIARGSIWVEDHGLSAGKCFLARPGSVTLWPAGYESRSISWIPRRTGAATEMIRIQLDMSVLQRLAPEDDRVVRQEVAQQPGIEDPALASLVRLMEADVQAGCPMGTLYGESLCLALATHVAGRYAAGSAKAPRLKGGLTRRQVERVRDYIETNLGGNLSLSELARVAGLSPQHFAIAFRNSVGVPPHRYVIGQRVREAKRLLATQRMSVAEVALTLGFASQSHFTEVFHRAVGMTPKRYQHK